MVLKETDILIKLKQLFQPLPQIRELKENGVRNDYKKERRGEWAQKEIKEFFVLP